MRLIDARLLKNKAIFIHVGGDVKAVVPYKDIINAPTIEAEPVKHGRCEYCCGATYTDKPFKVITQSGREVKVQFNYCPNCGAKMDGGNTE